MNQLKSKEIIRLVGVFLTALFALLTGFGIAIDPVLQTKAVELVSAFGGLVAVMWPLLEWARANVWSKDSAQVLANGVNQRSPSEKAREKAAEVLGAPPPPIQTAAPWAVEVAQTIALMTPTEIDDYVLEHGAEAFEAAMGLLKRVPTQQEQAERADEEAKKL